jgi:hypothetical protein
MVIALSRYGVALHGCLYDSGTARGIIGQLSGQAVGREPNGSDISIVARGGVRNGHALDLLSEHPPRESVSSQKNRRTRRSITNSRPPVEDRRPFGDGDFSQARVPNGPRCSGRPCTDAAGRARRRRRSRTSPLRELLRPGLLGSRPLWHRTGQDLCAVGSVGAWQAYTPSIAAPLPKRWPSVKNAEGQAGCGAAVSGNPGVWGLPGVAQVLPPKVIRPGGARHRDQSGGFCRVPRCDGEFGQQSAYK